MKPIFLLPLVPAALGACLDQPASIATAPVGAFSPLALERFCEDEADILEPFYEEASCASLRTPNTLRVRFAEPIDRYPWSVALSEPVNLEGEHSETDLAAVADADRVLLGELGVAPEELVAKPARYAMVTDTETRLSTVEALKGFYGRVVDGLPVFGERAVVSRSPEGAVSSLWVQRWRGVKSPAPPEAWTRPAENARAAVEAETAASSAVVNGWVNRNEELVPAVMVLLYGGDGGAVNVHVFEDNGEVTSW